MKIVSIDIATGRISANPQATFQSKGGLYIQFRFAEYMDLILKHGIIENENV